MNSNQRVFNNRYLVKKKISSGSFGVVFLGIDKNTKEEIAIKLEKEDNEEVKSLEREVEILTVLYGVVGIPKMHWSGEEQDYNVLIIQLLGNDLSYHFKNLKRFTLKTVAQLAFQILPIMERVHNKGVIHRDLKPENILLSRENDSQPIYLVDFGISKVFKDANGRHIPFRENKPFIGTTRYASIAAHKGYEISRKDDIESLFFVLLYFLRGSLPWQNMQVPDKERTKAVGEMKEKMDLADLCKGFPFEIFSYQNIRDKEKTPQHLQGSRISNQVIWSLNDQGPLAGPNQPVVPQLLEPPNKKAQSPQPEMKRPSNSSLLC